MFIQALQQFMFENLNSLHYDTYYYHNCSLRRSKAVQNLQRHYVR